MPHPILHHHHHHLPHHLHLTHALAIAVLLLIGTNVFPAQHRVNARSVRIDASAVFHRAPAYRLRIFSPSATGDDYMDLNITARDKTEIISGDIACNARPLNEFYEDDHTDGQIDYCEIILH